MKPINHHHELIYTYFLNPSVGNLGISIASLIQQKAQNIRMPQMQAPSILETTLAMNAKVG